MKNTVHIRIPILVLFLCVLGLSFTFLMTKVLAVGDTPIMGDATIVNTSNKVFFSSSIYGANVVISDPDPENGNRRTISGYAWSQDIGWIMFAQSETSGVFVDNATGAVSG